MAHRMIDAVTRLRSVDCCSVSDAMDKLAISAGVITGIPQESGSGRIAGRVITVKVGIGDPPPGPARHLGTSAVACAGSDDVIIVEQSAGVDAGCWGGILTLGAHLRQVAGVIADGPVRDIDEARELGFAIFATGLTARTARGRVVELGSQCTVAICGVRVDPGDFVIADGSAVIFIRADDILRVLDAAEAIIAREALMASALQSGAAIGEVMGGNYEHMLTEKA